MLVHSQICGQWNLIQPHVKYHTITWKYDSQPHHTCMCSVSVKQKYTLVTWNINPDPDIFVQYTNYRVIRSQIHADLYSHFRHSIDLWSVSHNGYFSVISFNEMFRHNDTFIQKPWRDFLHQKSFPRGRYYFHEEDISVSDILFLRGRYFREE